MFRKFSRLASISILTSVVMYQAAYGMDEAEREVEARTPHLRFLQGQDNDFIFEDVMLCFMCGACSMSLVRVLDNSSIAHDACNGIPYVMAKYVRLGFQLAAEIVMLE